MKSKSPLLKEQKQYNTPKHNITYTQSFIQKNTVGDSQKKKSDSKTSFVGKSLEKTSKSPKSASDFNYKKSEQIKCITTPSSCSKTSQRLHYNSQYSQKNSKHNMMNFILSNLGGKENKPQQIERDSCQYHQNKKAKYISEQDGINIKLCSKCSIEKAKQGYKLQEIQDGNKTQIKKISLINYQQKNQIQNLQSLPSEIQDSDRLKKEQELDNFKLTLNELIQYLNKQQNDSEFGQLEKAFNSLFESLLKVKNELIQELQKQQQEKKEQYQFIIDSVKKINQDIMDNEQNILETMELKPFKEIMDLYYQKIQEHKQSVAQISNKNSFEDLQLLVSDLTTQFSKNALEIIRPIEKKVFVSFQNGEIFQEALKTSRSRWPIQKVNSIPLIHDGQEKSEQEQFQEDQCQIESPNVKFQNLLSKINQRQSQTQQFLNYQQTLFDTDSPHFKN